MRIFASGSANKRIKKKYLEGIDKLADFITKDNHSIIIVGTTVGTIGKIYHEVYKRKGKIDVLSPLAFRDEAEGIKANSFLLVDSLFTMQRLFLSNSDVSIILPGGNGTLAEMFMLTDLIKSKYTPNKVIIYNINGFYDKIHDYLKFMLEEGVLEQFQLDYYIFCDTVEQVISELKKVEKTMIKTNKQ